MRIILLSRLIHVYEKNLFFNQTPPACHHTNINMTVYKLFRLFMIYLDMKKKKMICFDK